MRGTQADGRLTASGKGLRADPELLYLFDYYLSAQGERPLVDIVAAIRTELKVRLALSPLALTQAEELLTRYLAYKKALLALEQSKSSGSVSGKPMSAHLRERLSRLHGLRLSYFSNDEVMGLFAAEELRDEDALRRMEIFEDPRLSTAQKQFKLAQLDAMLPSSLREGREASYRISEVEQRVSQMRAAGASEQEVHQFRTQQFSADAAARLHMVDQEEQRWAGRVRDYQEDKRLLQQPTEGQFQSSAILQALRDRHFSSQEQRRLVAYDQ